MQNIPPRDGFVELSVCGSTDSEEAGKLKAWVVAEKVKVVPGGFRVVRGGKETGIWVENVLKEEVAEEEILADRDVLTSTSEAEVEGVGWSVGRDSPVIDFFVEDMDFVVDVTKCVVWVVSGVGDVGDCGLAVVSKSVNAEKINGSVLFKWSDGCNYRQ